LHIVLEQFFELEWDTFKDQTTELDLKRLMGNSSLELTAEARPNGFVTDTQWLPRADHFIFGQPLLFDRLTWHAHTSVGYAQMLTASAPTDPAQVAVISPLPWEANTEGVRAATRQEIDLPIDAGPVRVVPYLLGEAALIDKTALPGNHRNELPRQPRFPGWDSEDTGDGPCPNSDWSGPGLRLSSALL
jgi:hypothetical protein